METPFRAEVNGRACVVHAGADRLRIEHGAGCRDVPYSAVRCVQRDRRRITVNAEIGGRLVLYSVDAPGARRLHELLLAGCAGRAPALGGGPAPGSAAGSHATEFV